MPRLALLALAPLLLAAADEPLPPNQATEHVVKPGETLSGIAQRAEVPRVLIIEANRLTPPYMIRAGQKLVIPRTRRHTVGRGDTRFTISYLYGVPWADIAVANGLEAGAELRQGQTLLIPSVIPAPPAAPAAAAPAAPQFAWPLAGTVRRGFTARGRSGDYHDGLDIRVPEGTAVRASAAGKVLFAGTEPRQFGRLVVIEHEGGWQSAYAFLSRITVKEGEEVRQGERIGLSGRTGMASSPELHFELRRANRPVDPAEHLPER
jgi:murein DD-endopeptidase MepM/ murein hydrolase activator NlpD